MKAVKLKSKKRIKQVRGFNPKAIPKPAFQIWACSALAVPMLLASAKRMPTDESGSILAFEANDSLVYCVVYEVATKKIVAHYAKEGIETKTGAVSSTAAANTLERILLRAIHAEVPWRKK